MPPLAELQIRYHGDSYTWSDGQFSDINLAMAVVDLPRDYVALTETGPAAIPSSVDELSVRAAGVALGFEVLPEMDWGAPEGATDGATVENITKHMGPGPHPSGTPQSVHGRGGLRRGASAPELTRSFEFTGDPDVLDRIESIDQTLSPMVSSPTKRGSDTLAMYGEWDGDDFIGWTPERYAWQQEVIAAHEALQIEENGRPPKQERRALMMVGMTGAGKTFTLRRFAPVDLADYVVVNPDALKESIIFDDAPPQIDGISGLELSTVVHEETSFMARQWTARLTSEGTNLVLDISGAKKNSTLDRIQKLKDAGYTIDIVHVDVTPEQAWTSTVKRYVDGRATPLGGRPIPQSVFKKMVVDRGTDTIDQNFPAYTEAVNGNWWHYRNDPVTQSAPELVNEG